MFFLLTVCVVTLISAWLINLVVGWIRGEHSNDTGRLWGDMLLRVLAVMRLGVVGEILNRAISNIWAQRILFLVGGVVLLGMIFHTCNR